MPTPKEAIEPGSLPSGTRGPTEDAFASLGGGGQPVPGGLPGAPQGAPGGNPLEALLGGNVVPQSGNPLTAGLSVGPGTTPDATFAGVPDEMTQRLRLLASSARTPHLRYLARKALKNRVRMDRRATRRS